MKNKIIVILIIAITLFSLNVVKSQTINENKNWLGKKMILPSGKLMRNESSKYRNPLSKKLKILTIINGSCPACIDELKNWKAYMKTVDTTQVGFIYLVHSEDDLFTFKELNRDYIKLYYPYFYDIKKSITKANKLKDNNTYHTFLLNNKNEVILVGNPNKNIELFKKYNVEINRRIEKKKPNLENREGVNGTASRIEIEYIYKDQNGKILKSGEWEKMMSDNNYIPNIDTKKGVIIFTKR